MKFVERKTTPEKGNKYYTTLAYGGYNRCININNGYVLPNCCGYAFGRYMEEQNMTTCKLCVNDARDWYSYSDGYARGQEPKLGAVMCFDNGTYGHVAIVEEILDNGDVVTSNSAYGGSTFYMKTYYKKDGYGFQGKSGWYRFQGFIYPDTNFSEDKPSELAKDGEKIKELERKIEELEKENKSLKNELNKKESYKEKYTIEKNGKYQIYLKKGEVLIIK